MQRPRISQPYERASANRRAAAVDANGEALRDQGHREKREKGDEEAKENQQRHPGDAGEGDMQLGVKVAVGFVVVGRFLIGKAGVFVGLGLGGVFGLVGALVQVSHRTRPEGEKASRRIREGNRRTRSINSYSR